MIYIDLSPLSSLHSHLKYYLSLKPFVRQIRNPAINTNMFISHWIRNRSLFRSLALLSTLLLILMGCSKSDDSEIKTADQSNSQVELSMVLTISSLKRTETASALLQRQANFTADQVLEGQLSAFNTDTLVTSTFAWSIYMDEDTWEVQSNKTIILPPGAYEFSLLLTKSSEQYAGEAFLDIYDGVVDIPITIRPIIGDTISDVSLVGTLADFKFQYDPDELSTASLIDPRMGIIVDSGNEEIFSINPVTGISDNYINLESGSHSIQLKLYDGGIQKGRSIAEQESVIIAAGLNIAMDMIALQGETALTLTEDGGSANFNFTIPDEVVDEAGGTQNLKVMFSMVGSRNSLHEHTLSLAQAPSGDYETSVTLTGIQVDYITVSLTFSDISSSPAEQLGSCNGESTLDSIPRSISCDMTLRRRAVASGSLLATVGINVLNNLGEPISGATVSQNGSILGISGSGIFGASGYIKLFMNAGSHILKAETAQQTGLGMAILTPLSVNNLDIIIENRPSFTKVIYDRDVSAGKEIYIMDADGLNQERLTYTAENPAGTNISSIPQYSMYLNRILFSSNQNGSYEWTDLYSMELDGSGITPLTADNLKHNHFTLSIDGLIYYSHWNTNTDLYLMNLDGSGKALLPWSSTPDVTVQDISISNQILYLQDGDLRRIDNFGTEEVLVGEKNGDLVFVGASWSPDGTKILSGRHDASSHELWIMNYDGTNRIQIGLGTLEVGTGQHRFSPDGTQVLFSAALPGEAYDIYVANADGSDITNLTNTPGISESHPFSF